MKNQVIKNLTPEMGKEIIEYWESLGVDTRGREGTFYENNDDKCIYYGVINGVFDNYYLIDVTDANAEIIELPSKDPKRGDRALFWDRDKSKAKQAIFLSEIKGAEIPFIVVSEHSEKDFLEGKTFGTVHYRHIRPIPKKTVTQDEITKLGLEAYAKLHNTSVDNILIN